MAKRTKRRNIRVSKKRVSRKKYTRKNKRKYTKKYGNTRRKIRKNKMRGGGKRYQAVNFDGSDPFRYDGSMNSRIDMTRARVSNSPPGTYEEIKHGEHTIKITNNGGRVDMEQTSSRGMKRRVEEMPDQASGPPPVPPFTQAASQQGEDDRQMAAAIAASLDTRGAGGYVPQGGSTEEQRQMAAAIAASLGTAPAPAHAPAYAQGGYVPPAQGSPAAQFWAAGGAPAAPAAAPAPAYAPPAYAPAPAAGSPAAQFQAQQGQFGAPAPAAAASARPEWGPGTTVKLTGNLTLKNQRNGDAVIPGGSTLTVYYQAETKFGRGRHFRAIFGEKDGWVSNYDLTQVIGAPGPAGGAGGAPPTPAPRGSLSFYDKDKALYELTNFWQSGIQDDFASVILRKHVVWPTAEHYFQVYKFLPYGPAVWREIANKALLVPGATFNLPGMGPKWGEQEDVNTGKRLNFFPRGASDKKGGIVPHDAPWANGWQNVRDKVMYNALKLKFKSPRERSILIATYPEILIENAGHNDKYWGDGNLADSSAQHYPQPEAKGEGGKGTTWTYDLFEARRRAGDRFVGQNKLGFLLMQIRDEARAKDGLQGATICPDRYRINTSTADYNTGTELFDLTKI
jgi:predicted NAD-dependent protein-ADP-ribosyltransferase YbiA (DUF1768 family)